MELQERIIIFFAVTFLWQTSFSSIIDVEKLSSTVTVENSMLTVENSAENITSIYDITVKDLNGNDVCLNKYKGQVLLIVNYASTCLFTLENEINLSELALKYGPRGLKVLIFPSNTFCENIGGNDAGIALQNEHPEFDVFYQVSVNGANTDLLYVYLKNKLADSALGTSAISWNFVKFLVDSAGTPNKRFSTYDTFASIEEAVEKLLI